MVEHAHGGDREGFLRAYGQAPLDFSANVNPLGVPSGVKRAIAAAAETADAYPDPYCRALRECLSEKTGVPAEWILCGNGAADLIFRIAYGLRPKRALMPAPTFAEYAQALAAAGCGIERHALHGGNGFRVDDSLLERLRPGIDILFLCNPNNPTGALLPEGFLARAAARCLECGCWLAVDECFLSFADNPERHSALPLLAVNPRVIVLDAFTKLYGMAGVRLGFLSCADARARDRIAAAGQPWAVSSLAQAAGLAALDEEKYVRESLALIKREKPFLREGLARLGMRVFDSDANYLFFHSELHDLKESLAARGVMIRSCANYEGLGAGYYRVAVRTRPENEALLAAMGECAGP